MAVHFRDERGFAIFSLAQPDGTGIRALGYLPSEVTLCAVVRIRTRSKTISTIKSARVCTGRMKLFDAQRAIATD